MPLSSLKYWAVLLKILWERSKVRITSHRRGPRAFQVVPVVKNPPANGGDAGPIPGLGRSPRGGHGNPLQYAWASLVAQMVKNTPAMQETWVRSLSWEDPLEEGMTTHSSILAWKIPWTEDPGGLQSMGSQRVGHNCSNSAHRPKLLKNFL